MLFIVFCVFSFMFLIYSSPSIKKLIQVKLRNSKVGTERYTASKALALNLADLGFILGISDGLLSPVRNDF